MPSTSENGQTGGAPAGTLVDVNLDQDACYQALLARDPRFDGVFFTGVSTTGIYCRPVCRARTPRRTSCTFYRTGAEAEKAGYRACLRCRPELAPGNSSVDAVSHLVARAVAHIEAGAFNERTVDQLAGSLGVTDRHLRRAMESELGITPVELAQSRRIALAKQLLHDTSLDLAQVAFASGFSSVRRFNALFHARFGRPPSEVRRSIVAPARRGTAGDSVALVLDYRPPLGWDGLLGFLGARAIPGVERVTGGMYERTVRIGERSGTVAVRPHGRRNALTAIVSPGLTGALMPIAARLRALFDLDANPVTIGRQLARDPLLAGSVRAHPGLRVPGAFDPFEMSVRAVLGQQVSVRAATTLAGRLARAFGSSLAFAGPPAGDLAPSLVFPAAPRLAALTTEDIAAIGLPRARAASLGALARASASGTLDLAPGQPPRELVARLEALPGLGPWSAEYIAMRALGDPDAFPAGDLGVRKALGGCSPARARDLAAAWSPWRSYAVMHLWTRLSEGNPR